MKNKYKRLLSQTLIGAVLFINLKIVFLFFFWPEKYALFYELRGDVGAATIRGFAVLFLMWNIPYLVALVNPLKYRISLYEAIAMQSIGLIGESIIFWHLPPIHAILRGSVTRFIIFDAGGLLLLFGAALVSRNKSRS